MRIHVFNVLEDEAAATTAAARSAFERDHPAAAASMGPELDSTFSRGHDAFVEVYVTGQVDTWDTYVQSVLAFESNGVGVLLDVPLGLVRAACDRLIEGSNSDGTTVEQTMRSLAELDETGQRVACRLVELYQARVGRVISA
jgi:hypothetical protein